MELVWLASLCFFTALTTVAGQQQCSASNCRLPDCFCPGRSAPNQIPARDVPQMVMLTFDDAITDQNYAFYQRLFKSGRNNPNGCPILATFFVSYNHTVFRHVEELHEAGHEIGSHSITHRFPISWWSMISYAILTEEFDGQRQHLVDRANVPREDIRGIRAPFLEAAPRFFEMLKNEGFKYDSTLFAGPLTQAAFDAVNHIWPYTLDFPTGLSEFCDLSGCPTQPYPGIWEIPVVRWLGLDGAPCSFMDACTTQDISTKAKVLQYLRNNFDRYYNRNRAPFGVHLHATWFSETHRLDALDEFISELLQKDDVYIVTEYQVIQWMKDPTTLANIKDFFPWKRSCDLDATTTTTSPDDVTIPSQAASGWSASYKLILFVTVFVVFSCILPVPRDFLSPEEFFAKRREKYRTQPPLPPNPGFVLLFGRKPTGCSRRTIGQCEHV